MPASSDREFIDAKILLATLAPPVLAREDQVGVNCHHFHDGQVETSNEYRGKPRQLLLLAQTVRDDGRARCSSEERPTERGRTVAGDGSRIQEDEDMAPGRRIMTGNLERRGQNRVYSQEPKAPSSQRAIGPRADRSSHRHAGASPPQGRAAQVRKAKTANIAPRLIGQYLEKRVPRTRFGGRIAPARKTAKGRRRPVNGPRPPQIKAFRLDFRLQISCHLARFLTAGGISDGHKFASSRQGFLEGLTSRSGMPIIGELTAEKEIRSACYRPEVTGTAP